MICKKCGTLIKHNEEYCRKCGALVITFKQVENKNLKHICVENNIRGKWQKFINKISNKDAKSHKVENINKNSLNINDLGDLVNKYNKVVKNSLADNKHIKEKHLKREEIKTTKDFPESITDIIQELFKL